MKHESDEARAIAEANTILLTQVGSGLHGVTIEGTDDRDEMGVCIEPPDCVIGLREFEQYQWRTQPEGVRSGPGDLDLVIYSLRKWTRLAAQGNPTVLLLLFVPSEEIVEVQPPGLALQDSSHLFLSRDCGRRFIGYLDAQRDRMLGLRSQRTNRPELVDVYGFDCYLDDTEFLTRRGWMAYDDVGDEDLATINQKTGRMEFQRPTERVEKPYDGPICIGNSYNGNWAVTPNHRMWVSKMVRGSRGVNPRAYDPKVASWSFRSAVEIDGLDWHQRVAAEPSTDEYPVSDAHLALIGAYVSEGSVAKRLKDGSASVLSMCQIDDGRLHDTMALVASEYSLRSYRYEYEGRSPCTTWTLANREVANEIDKSCGAGSINKRLPEWVLNLSGRQADVLLKSLLNGDGTPLKTGGWVYYTQSERLAGDVQALAVTAGRRSNTMGPYRAYIYQVSIHDRGTTRFGTFRGRDIEVRNVINRRIVCFTVPNEILVTRRNGHVAMHGNTKFAYHAIRLGLQGVELLSTGRITLPIPEPERAWLHELRLGKHTKDEALDRISDLRDQLVIETVATDFPDKPDYDQLNRWLIDTYQEWWHR